MLALTEKHLKITQSILLFNPWLFHGHTREPEHGHLAHEHLGSRNRNPNTNETQVTCRSWHQIHQTTAHPRQSPGPGLGRPGFAAMSPAGITTLPTANPMATSISCTDSDKEQLCGVDLDENFP